MKQLLKKIPYNHKRIFIVIESHSGCTIYIPTNTENQTKINIEKKKYKDALKELEAIPQIFA